MTSMFSVIIEKFLLVTKFKWIFSEFLLVLLYLIFWHLSWSQCEVWTQVLLFIYCTVSKDCSMSYFYLLEFIVLLLQCNDGNSSWKFKEYALSLFNAQSLIYVRVVLFITLLQSSVPLFCVYLRCHSLQKKGGGNKFNY